MDIIEKLYNEFLVSYYNGSNYSIYDCDYQLTKNRLENILLDKNITQDDVDFIYSLFSEIENKKLIEEIKEYLDFYFAGDLLES